jgi:phage anti-repressor protein
MEELIPINPNNPNNPVSARDLHTFLESKKDFSSWIKAKIEKYGFVENIDYLVLPQKGELENQRVRIEYALTLNTAKELAMVEGNKKGKMARRYFIACEERLKSITQKPMSLEEMMINQLQARIEDRKRIEQIESKVNKLIEDKEEAGKEMLLLDRSAEAMPEESMRAKIMRIVNAYRRATLKGYSEIWNIVYDRLYYRYKISIRKYKKRPGESNLDVAERNEFLDKIFVIVSNELVI